MNEKLEKVMQWANAVLPGCAYYEAAEYGSVVWDYWEVCYNRKRNHVGTDMISLFFSKNSRWEKFEYGYLF